MLPLFLAAPAVAAASVVSPPPAPPVPEVKPAVVAPAPKPAAPVRTTQVQASRSASRSTVAPAAPASTPVPQGNDFLALVNELRASKGVAPLVVDAQLTANANAWAAKMAAKGGLSHQSLGSVMLGQTARGENVARGSSVAQMFAMLVNSPGHLANMIDPKYTRIGIGISNSGKGMFAAQEFGAI